MTFWLGAIVRGTVALVLALVVTFSADHSAGLGLVTLGIFGVSSGVVIAGITVRTHHDAARTIQLVQASISIVCGVSALLLVPNGLSALIPLTVIFATTTGLLELANGIRGRGRHPNASDWVFAGALTVALSVAVLVVPADLAQQFTGPDGVARELTASVVIVGLLSAYWAVIGVYLVIAGLSLKWASQPRTDKKIEAS